MTCLGQAAIRVMVVAYLLSSLPAQAQEADVNSEVETVSSAVTDPAVRPEKRTNRIIIPIPMGGPQTGGGLAIAAVWFYQPKGAVRPWTSGGGVFRTSNKSWGVVAAQNMSLAQDKFRLQLVGVYSDINLRYFDLDGRTFDEDNWTEVNQRSVQLLASGKVQVGDSIFVGARARYMDQDAAVRDISDAAAASNVSAFSSKVTVVDVGPTITFDNTDDAFVPRTGTIVDARWMFAVPAIGSTVKYNKFNISAKQYLPSGDQNSIAMQAKACAASNSTPFFDDCSIGLRGYSNGRFRDKASWSMEAEWRQRLSRKFGIVLFAGAGSTGSNLGNSVSSGLLPSVGAGVRYLLAETYGINLRIDGAVGRDSEAVYVSIGESF